MPCFFFVPSAGEIIPGLFICKKSAFVHSAHKPCHDGAIFAAMIVQYFVPVFVQKTCHVHAVFCACFAAMIMQYFMPDLVPWCFAINVPMI